jgi:transcriptional regulator
MSQKKMTVLSSITHVSDSRLSFENSHELINMHIPLIFAENRTDELHRIVRAYPLATIVLSVTHGLEVNLLPLELHESTSGTCLRGHVARNHPIAIQSTSEGTALVVFQGPNAYISPKWYVNGQRSGRVAPSWNYIAVQARGILRLVDDRDWMLTHLASLTESQESSRVEPWSMAQAAPQFIDEVSEKLIGFEIGVTELVGRSMLSQQRTVADRQSLISHLALEPSASARELGAFIAP